MVLLEFLYDARNEKYPICHSGILTFVITTCLPINIGMSRLPPIDVFMLLIAGFVSLFMLARNEKVGLGILNHLRVKKLQRPFVQTRFANQMYNGHCRVISDERTESRQGSFILLQNIIEYIMIKDEKFDLRTHVRLKNMHQKLQTKTRQLCKLDA
jgi:hypothetical protein